MNLVKQVDINESESLEHKGLLQFGTVDSMNRRRRYRYWTLNIPIPLFKDIAWARDNYTDPYAYPAPGWYMPFMACWWEDGAVKNYKLSWRALKVWTVQ